MAFNGSGVFVRLYNWVNDATGGIKIRADRMDAEFDGMATGLTNCLTKDGQTTVTANLPMAGFKHTGVANGSSATDYTALGQMQMGAPFWGGTAGGTVDVITLSLTPAITSLAAGIRIVFVTGGTNTTNVTLAVNGLTAKAVTKFGSTALAAGDMPVGVAHVIYDGTQFQLLSHVVGVVPVANGGTGLTSLATFAFLANAQTFTAAQRPSETVLTSSAGSIAINLALNNDFTHTFTENTTLANPTNIVVGQSGAIRLTQHASSPKTLAFGSYYNFVGGVTPTITATNSARDTLFYSVRSSTQIECSFSGNWS